MNSVKHTILNSKTIIDENGNVINLYNIAGTAWEDSNNNGKLDSNEDKIGNVEVCLIDAQTGNIVYKATSDEQQKVTTSSDGIYKFTDVKAGTYIVVFLYNYNVYDITQYKKEGLLETENSDAIKAEIKMNNEIKTAGVTENIQVSNEGIYGVNIGLIRMNNLIFGIDKTVTKMVMKSPKNSKTVEFNNAKIVENIPNTKTKIITI